MADRTLFPTRIVAPEGVVFDGEVQEVDVPSLAGGMGILAGHSPVVADLKPGAVRVQLEDGTWLTWATAEGFAQAANSSATIVVEETVAADQIDTAAAAEIVTKAEAKLAAAGDDEHAKFAAKKSIEWGELLQRVKEQHGS